MSAGPQPEPAATPSWRLVLTLALAGLVSGLAIVSAYTLTLPRITANKAERLRQAVFEVLPGSKELTPLVWDGGKLAPVVKGEPEIYEAVDSTGAFVGYAVPGEGAGFQDNIKLIYGYKPSAGKIVGMQVLESRETPGLGDRILKDQHFLSQFRDLAVEPSILLVKGKGENRAPNEVDAITGATISSTAVVKILNATNATWFPRLKAPEDSSSGGGSLP